MLSEITEVGLLSNQLQTQACYLNVSNKNSCLEMGWLPLAL